MTLDTIFETASQPERAVVLLSGGMDSCTAMAQARADGAKKLIGVSVRYGSKHMEAETAAAREVARWFDAPQRILNLPAGLFQGAGSALMEPGSSMPHQSYEELHQQTGPSPTVVPFRNANLISIATAVAITHGAEYVYMGAHKEDARNWAYPDCTPEFLGAMANAVWVGSYHKVRLQFPFIWMNKADICKLALELNAPLHLTWSCYDPKGYFSASDDISQVMQCGECPTCVERIEAFRKNGIIDPVPYYHAADWQDCVPYQEPR